MESELNSLKETVEKLNSELILANEKFTEQSQELDNTKSILSSQKELNDVVALENDNLKAKLNQLDSEVIFLDLQLYSTTLDTHICSLT